MIILLILQLTLIEALTFSPAFINGFRRFWADTVDLATRLDDFSEDSDGDRFFDSAVEYQPMIDDRLGQVTETTVSDLEQHFRNLDNRDYFMVFLKEPADRLHQLLDQANLQQWTEVLYMKLGNYETVKRLLNLYWRHSSLSDREYRFILSSFSSDSDHGKRASSYTGYLHATMKSLVRLFIDHFDITGRDPLFRNKMISLALTVRHIIVKEVEISDFMNIREVLLNPEIGLDLNSLPPDVNQLFNSTIVGYFNSVGYSITGRMIASVLRLSAHDSRDETKLMIAALNKCGPGMQKVLQLVGKDAKSERLKLFLEHLKDSIEPMTERERHLVIENALGGIGAEAHGFIPRWIKVNEELEKKPVTMLLLELKRIVGSASIGEGWTARVHFAGKPVPETVFIKLMRWDVDRLMSAEIEFIESIKEQHPNLSGIIRELADGLAEETDFEAEAANQMLGHEMYDCEHTKRKHSFMYVPKPLGVFKNSRASVIVMPVEQGVTLKKALEDYLTVDNACSVVELQVQFMRQWISDLMVGRGMGHGDPHAGNVLIDFHRTPKYTSMIILDWGNVIRLSPTVQGQLYMYATGIFAKDESVVLEGLGRPSRRHSDPTSDDPQRNHGHEKWIRLEREVVHLFESLKRTLKTRRSLRSSSSFSLSNNRPSESSPSLSQESEGHISPSSAEEIFINSELGHTSPSTSSPNPSSDTFSLDSETVRERIIADDGWTFGDSIIILLDNIISKAVSNGLNIPPGTAGMLRARQFMESTLDAMSKHPAVVEAKCAVPRAYSIFFKGILFDGGVSGRKASAGVQSTKYLLKAAKNNLRRRLRDCLSSVVDCHHPHSSSS